MNITMNLKPDRSENVSYDIAAHPIYIRKGYLSYYLNYSAEAHWHDDIELIYILSGKMLYNINGETVLLKEKEGIFINARQLHFGYSDDQTECVFLCILLHPLLLCASDLIAEKFVSPVLTNTLFPYHHLTMQCDWEKRILDNIVKIYQAKDTTTAELKVQALFFDIWSQICENIFTYSEKQEVTSHHLTSLKAMIAYIDHHYTDKLNLHMIAKSGNVGKTNCCSIFKKYINKTPNEYLTDLRLRKSLSYLETSDLTIEEISARVGFSGASYYTETFRKLYHLTPTKYRKKIRDYS